jgi:hypothetical protein
MTLSTVGLPAAMRGRGDRSRGGQNPAQCRLTRKSRKPAKEPANRARITIDGRKHSQEPRWLLQHSKIAARVHRLNRRDDTIVMELQNVFAAASGSIPEGKYGVLWSVRGANARLRCLTPDL